MSKFLAFILGVFVGVSLAAGVIIYALNQAIERVDRQMPLPEDQQNYEEPVREGVELL